MAAKLARDNLARGKPHGISNDSDNDGLLIDSCPNEPEDRDGDADDDGCPEKGIGEMVGDAAGGVGDASSTSSRSRRRWARRCGWRSRRSRRA
jgi:hypothetical protein